MKKKILSTLTATAMCVCVCMGAAPGSEKNAVDYNDTVTIGVEKNLSYLDILDIENPSYEANCLFTMIYDRLFSINEYGKFVPELATEMYLLDNGEQIDIYNGDGFSPSDNQAITDSMQAYYPLSIEGEELLSGWNNYKIPGWTDLSSLFLSDDIEFFDGNGSVELRFKLRDNVKFSNGEDLAPAFVEQFVSTAQMHNKKSYAYKYWSCVSSIVEDEPNIMTMNLDFDYKNYGFVDFLYFLSSPMGSIVNGFFPERPGTGAYYIDYQDDYALRLRKNQDWWGRQVNTEEVNFKYINESVGMSECDISMVKYNNDIIDHYKEDDDYTVNRIVDNPIICLYNPYSDKLTDIAVRRGVSYVFAQRELWVGRDMCEAIIDGLSNISNGYWTYTDKTAGHDELVLEFDNIRSTIGEQEDNTLKVIVPSDEMNDYARTIAQVMQNMMNNGNFLFNMRIEVLSKEEYDRRVLSMDFDLALSVNDLFDMDSAYNAFLRLAYEEETLTAIKKIKAAKNTVTFISQQAEVQMLAFNDVLFTNFGWTTCDIVQNANISGVTYYGSFHSDDGGVTCFSESPYPMSDMGRIDFRWVTKTA